MHRLLLSLLAFAAVAHAINVASVTYDLDKLKLQEVLFLNTSEFKTEPVTHTVIAHFTENFDTVGASVMRPWEYVVLTADGDVVYSQVISVKDRTSTKPVPLMDAQNPVQCSELQCSSSTCFCIDLSQHRFVSFDPVTGNVSTAIDFAGSFSGLVEFQSAFDRRHNVGYYVLLDKVLASAMYSVNFRSGAIDVLPGAFFNNNTEAYCFDPSLGLLLATNHPAGGIVAFDPATNATTVLLQRDLWGITSSPPACSGGEMLVQIVDW
jgi:hypothetical protein